MVSTGHPVVAASAPIRLPSLAREVVNEGITVPIESVVAADFSLLKARKERRLLEMLEELRSNIATGGGWAGLLAMGACLGRTRRIELLCASVSPVHAGRHRSLDRKLTALILSTVPAGRIGRRDRAGGPQLRRRARSECLAGRCAAPGRRFFAKAALGFAAALVALDLVWPRIIPLLLG